ncbi:tipc, putative [Entamoeba invadens IP1]|uniref:tipc, putative n=1 Tax=Entamoeba invadens IP1 TaxID=370355 RepID=UPI0002C3F2F1|nr:tipc, putative [Entamoeba invadens IP1]ELP93350.1 tipc, putative [Entamoeba invadens IP1]|eukprot:XP_004260121.1 tipc, putative [Entamoeba invadens IP1]
MFEGLIADFLTKTIGKYIEDLDVDSVTVSLWNGNVKLKDLRVKRDACSSLNLPVQITTGILSNLEVEVPWKTIKKDPFKIKISGINIIARPQTNFVFDNENFEKQKAVQRNEVLERFELMQQITCSKTNSDEKSFVTSLVNKIVENVEVEIHDIKFVYIGNKNEGILGFHLENVSVQNEKNDTEDVITKKCTLSNMSIFALVPAKEYSECVFGSECDEFRTEDFVKNEIAKIPSFEFNLQIEKTVRHQITLSGEVKELFSSITRLEYQQIINIVEHMTTYTQTLKYLYCRPTVSAQRDPKKWWKFAFTATRDYLRQKEEDKTPIRTELCLSLRDRFVELFKKVRKVPYVTPATQPETEELQKIEDSLRVQEICYLRKSAYQIVNEEKKRYENSRGWFGFGYQIPQLDEKTIKDIYNAIEYHQDDFVLPPETVVFVSDVNIRNVSFSLCDDGDIIRLGISNFNIHFEARVVGLILKLCFEDGIVSENKIGLGTIWQKTSQQKAFQLCFEKSPTDKHADSVVTLECANSVIHCSKNYLDSIAQFLKLSSDLNLDCVKQFAEFQLQQLYSSAATQLDIFSENPPIVDIKINLNAPVVFFHYDQNERGMTGNVLKISFGNLKVSNLQNDENYQNFLAKIQNIEILLLESLDEVCSNKNTIVQKTGASITVSTKFSNAPLTKVKLCGEVEPFIAKISKRKYDKILAYIFLFMTFIPDSLKSPDELSSVDNVDKILVSELVKKTAEIHTVDINVNIPVFCVVLAKVGDLEENEIMTAVEIKNGNFCLNVLPESVFFELTLNRLKMKNGLNDKIPFLVESNPNTQTLQNYFYENENDSDNGNCFDLSKNDFVTVKIKVVGKKVDVWLNINTFAIVYEPSIISEIITFCMSLSMFPESDTPNDYIYNIDVTLSHFFFFLQNETKVYAVGSISGLDLSMVLDNVKLDLGLNIHDFSLKNVLYQREDPRYSAIVSSDKTFMKLKYVDTNDDNYFIALEIGEVLCNFVMEDFFVIWNVFYDKKVQRAVDLTSMKKAVEDQYEYLKKSVTHKLENKNENQKTTDIKVKSPQLTAYLPYGQVIVRLNQITIEDGCDGWEILFDTMKVSTCVNQKREFCVRDFTFIVDVPIKKTEITFFQLQFPFAEVVISPDQFKILLIFLKTFFSEESSGENNKNHKNEKPKDNQKDEIVDLADLEPISKKVTSSIEMSMKKFEITIRGEIETICKLKLGGFGGNVNLTENGYAIFDFFSENLEIDDLREKVEMKEYREIYRKVTKGNVLNVKGNYYIQTGNVQSNVNIHPSSLILAPKFIRSLIAISLVFFDGKEIEIVNTEDPLLQASTKTATTGQRDCLVIVSDEEDKDVERDKTTENKTDSNNLEDESVSGRYIREHLLHLKDPKSGEDKVYISKGLGKKSQAVEEIVRYLNDACPLPMTPAEVILVLKANYEWHYPQYVCEYICEELVRLGLLVPEKGNFLHNQLPNIDSSVLYHTVFPPKMSQVHIDLTSFQPARPPASAITPKHIHVFTFAIKDLAVVAVQDDSPDTELLYVKLSASVCHTVTNCGSNTLSELQIEDIRTCFSKGHSYTPEKGVQLSTGISASFSVTREFWDNWYGIRGGVNINNVHLKTTVSDLQLLYFFFKELQKIGGETNYEVDSENSFRIDLNEFKMVVGNPLRKDPFCKVKIPGATLVYRSRNDDSVFRVVGEIKVDGYNPRTREYDVLLEKSLVEFKRRDVIDCIQGILVNRNMTEIDVKNIEMIFTVDFAKELQRIMKIDFTKKNEEKESFEFVPIQFVDVYSMSGEGLFVSINGCGTIRLNNKLQHFENMTQQREYSDMKKCVVMSSDGDGIEVPIVSQGEYVHNMFGGKKMVVSVNIEENSSKVVKFSTLLAIDNGFEEELFLTFEAKNPKYITKNKENDNQQEENSKQKKRVGSLSKPPSELDKGLVDDFLKKVEKGSEPNDKVEKIENMEEKKCRKERMLFPKIHERPRMSSTSTLSKEGLPILQTTNIEIKQSTTPILKHPQPPSRVRQNSANTNATSLRTLRPLFEEPEFLKVDVSLQPKELYYVPPQLFGGNVTICSSRIKAKTMPLSELFTEKIIRLDNNRCVLTRVLKRNIAKNVQTIIKLSPSLTVTNMLPMPFVLKSESVEMPIPSRSSISTFIDPQSVVQITIPGYMSVVIPQHGELKIFSIGKGENTIRYLWEFGNLRIDAEEWVYNRSFIPLKLSLDKKNLIGNKVGVGNNSQPIPITRANKPLFLGIGNCWSKALYFEKMEDFVSIEANNTCYTLNVLVETTDDSTEHNRQIIIRPSYMAINDLEVPIYLTSTNTNDLILMPPKSNMPLYFNSKMNVNDKKIAVSINPHGPWCLIPTDLETHFQTVFLRKENGAVEEGIPSTISIDVNKSTIVKFEKVTNQCSYVLENDTQYEISLKRMNSEFVTIVKKNQKMELVFPNTSNISSIQISADFTNNKFIQYNLDYPQVYEAKGGMCGIVYPYTWISNDVTVLVFTQSWDKTLKDIGGLIGKENINTTEFRANIGRLGVDVIDQNREEISYISTGEVSYTCLGSFYKTRHRLFVEPFQVDSNARDCSIAVPFLCKGVTVSLDIISQEENTFKYIPNAFVKIQPLRIKLETPFVHHVLKVYEECFRKEGLKKKDEILKTPELFLTPKEVNSSPTFTFDNLYVSPIDINISTELSPSFLVNIPYNSFTAPLHVIGTSVLTITSARLHLNEINCSKLTATNERFGMMLMDFYRELAMQQLVSAVSSMELIGAPGAMVNSFADGITDFVTYTRQERRNGNGLSGVGKGTESLLRNSIHGVSSTAAALSNTVGNLAASLTFDEEFIRKRQMQLKPNNVSEGILDGLKCILEGIMEGGKGIVMQPYKGARKSGVYGLIGGIGKGIVGVVMKPVGGVVDFTAKVTEGIVEESSEMVLRARIPRIGMKSKRILEYNNEENKIAWIVYKKGLGDFVVYVKTRAKYIVLTETMFVILKDEAVIYTLPLDELMLKIEPDLVRFKRFEREVLKVHYKEGKHMRVFIRIAQQYIRCMN